MHRAPILTSHQSRWVNNAADALPLDSREDFLRRVHMRLAGVPADSAVCHAINLVLDLTPRDER
jgi:hypothetical protein